MGQNLLPLIEHLRISKMTKFGYEMLGKAEKVGNYCGDGGRLKYGHSRYVHEYTVFYRSLIPVPNSRSDQRRYICDL